MSENRLTPRVGDRVVGKDENRVTRVGVVRSFGEVQAGPDEFHPMVQVDLDGLGLGNFYEHDLTVVDREPMNWPNVPSWAYGDLSWEGNSRHEANMWKVSPSIVGPSVSVDASAVTAKDAWAISEAWARVADEWHIIEGCDV